MATIFLGLGSNEAPERNLRLAIRELAARYGELALSPVYRSAAVGFEGADFLNLVVRMESDVTPLEIAAEVERIHNMAGPLRGSDKWESRPIDIDLLLYNDLVDDALRIPRGDVLRFSFVLRPLSDIAPEHVHPVTGKTFREHWQEFDQQDHPLKEISIAW